MWWSSLEFEKRKSAQISPIVSVDAPDPVINAAQRSFVKGVEATESGKSDLLDVIKHEFTDNGNHGTFSIHQDYDLFGLMEGASTNYIDVEAPKDIIDIYGLHDENTLQTVTPCKTVSLLRETANIVPPSVHNTAQSSPEETAAVSLMSQTWSPSSELQSSISTDLALTPMNDAIASSNGGTKTMKASKSTIADIGSGVGKLMARTSFGRAFGNYRSPPEPEDADPITGGTVGQLLEVTAHSNIDVQHCTHFYRRIC